MIHVFLVLLHGAMDWAAVCDSGMSWPYSLKFLLLSLGIFIDPYFMYASSESFGMSMHLYGQRDKNQTPMC